MEWLKEIFPVEAVGPLAGGVILWFGLNVAFLAPNVVVPRLAERYYLPACEATVEADRAAVVKTTQEAQAAYVVSLNRWMDETSARTSQTFNNVLGSIFGQYGKEGQAFLDHYGGELKGYSDKLAGQASPAIVQQANQALAEWQSERQREAAALRAQQKYHDVASFCGCNVTAALSNNVEIAIHSSSLRLFKPKGVLDLENGRVFEEECGKAPVA